MLKPYLPSYDLFSGFSHAEEAIINSNCKKRKVGACLRIEINGITRQLVFGCNYHDLSNCKCVHGSSDPFVIHAEQTVMQGLREVSARPKNQYITLYVTYEPCLKCAKTIVKKGVHKVYYRDSSRLHDGLQYLINNGIEVYQHWI